MGAASARVQTTIVIGADDKASKALAKVQSQLAKADARLKSAAKSSNKFGASFDRATSKANRLGGALRSMVSGDVKGSISSVSGLLGPGAGIAGTAALAAVGVAAVAVGVGLAAKKFTEWSIEIERSRAALDATFGQGKGVESAIGFAEAIGGVGVDSVAKLATTLKATGINARITAEQMGELTARATLVGKDGDQALSALAAAISKGNTGALKMVGTFVNATQAMEAYGNSIGVSASKMDAKQRSAAVLAAVLKDLETKTGANSSAFAKQDRLLARLDVAWTKLKFGVSSYLNGPASGLLKSFTVTIEKLAQFGKVMGIIGKMVLQSMTKPFRAAGTALAGLAAAAAQAARGNFKEAGAALKRLGSEAYSIGIGETGDATKNLYKELLLISVGSKKVTKEINITGNAYDYYSKVIATANGFVASSSDKAAKAAKARAAAAKRGAKATANAAKARAAAAKNAAYGVAQARAGQAALLKYRQDDLATEGLIAKAKKATAKGTQQRIEAERNLIDIATRRQVLDIENSKLDPTDKAKRIEAIKTRARVELTTKIVEIRKSGQAIRDAQRAEARKEAQEARARVAKAAGYVGSVAGSFGGEFAQAAGRAAGAVQRISGSWRGMGKAAPDAITAVGSVATAFVSGERTKAAIMAITEGAAALASIAIQDYPGAAAHGASAVLYGLAAGGVIGGASGGAPAVGGSAGGNAGSGFTASPSSSTSAPSTGGNTYIFAGITQTKPQLQRQLRRDQRVLVGTGV